MAALKPGSAISPLLCRDLKSRSLARIYGRGAQWETMGRKLDGQFQFFRRTFGLPFKAWAERTVGTGANPTTLFYPFGGPDFCFPHYLFPNARDYILVGFEPCPLWPLDDGSATFDLTGTAAAMRHYLSFSYFITKDLHRSLSGSDVQGVLPLLLMQIVRCGLPLLSVEPTTDGIEGLCITFGETHSPRRLYYYRQDLRDGYWSESCSLYRRIAAASRLAVFVKSGSYLLHEPPFERLRHVIRDCARVLVQDPSGVPYDLLQRWQWCAGLHGHFTSDIPVFSATINRASPAPTVHQNGSARLDFGIGYLANSTA